MHNRTRPFLRRTRFVFRIQRRRSFVSKKREAIPRNSSEKPTRRLERVVLNTLAEQMPLCRLIFGPVQCYENFILRLRRLASSSEMPIHLSRGQRARLQPTKDHLPPITRNPRPTGEAVVLVAAAVLEQTSA